MEQPAPEGLSPVPGTHAGPGEQCNEEGTAEITSVLSTAPFPIPLCLWWGGGRESTVNLSL